MGIVTLNRRQFLQAGVAMAGLSLLNGCGVVAPLDGKPTRML